MRSISTRTVIAALALFLVACSNGRRDAMEDFVDQWRVHFNSHDLSGFASMYAPEGTYMTPGMIYFARPEIDEATRERFRALGCDE